MRENPPDFSHCLFELLELGCLLPPFQLLGFIWHQMSLELVQSTGRIACHCRGDAIARLDRIRGKIVSACSSANLSPVVEKKNLIQESQSHPGDIFFPTWKAGKPAAFNITVISSLQSNSLINAATKAGYALDAAEERKYCLHDNDCAKMGIIFVPLAIEVLGGISATFNKTLKRLAVLSDNRSFQAQGLSVAFCKLMQSLSITAIRGSAEMLLARAP